MAKEIHVGDVGTIFEVEITDQADAAVDISGATTKQIKFTKPVGTDVTQTAAFSGTGTDGKMRYLTVAADLSADGDWALQGYVVIPAGTWHTDVGTFKVLPNLS